MVPFTSHRQIRTVACAAQPHAKSPVETSILSVIVFSPQNGQITSATGDYD